MSNKSERPDIGFINYKRILITAIVTLAIITIIYQLRPFLDDSQFAWISVPAYFFSTGILTLYAAVLAVRLYRKKHYQAKAFLLFFIGAAFWFIAEHIWQFYDHILNEDPFPSEADIFYLGAYPFMAAFLFLSLKPILKTVSRNVWLFAIGLSFSFLIPSVFAAYDDMLAEAAFDTAIVLSYPILSSVLVVPAIIGFMFLAKRGTNLSWMLILFAFITYAIADTFFLFLELAGAYYDGHFVDLLWIFTYVMLIFALHIRLKISKLSSSEKQAMFFNENIRFETISKFGIPLTVAIICMIILISLVDAVILQPSEELSTPGIVLGVIAMLVVFVAIVITINKNLSRLVTMRTDELVEQRNNLENLVEKKTQEVLKSERLSAIGELSGRLAHDLRNPLSVMKMSIELIKQTPEDSKISNSNIMNRIGLIEKSVDRISHQVDDVLSYVRISPLNLTNASLHELVQGSLEKINIPKDVDVNFTNNDVKVDCDAIKLDAVFINLIVNSIQAMPTGGKIEMKISEKNDFAILQFIDSGEGITDENTSRIFEPLFTTKQKGTGLGLASCKNIIDQHNGKINVTNNPTTFTVTLCKRLH